MGSMISNTQSAVWGLTPFLGEKSQLPFKIPHGCVSSDSMSENLAESTVTLKQLVAQIMNETDPVRYDELGSEIWRVLEERKRLSDAPSADLASPPIS